MSVAVVLDIPEETMRLAQMVADRTQRRIEDVLIEWLKRGAAKSSVEKLSDDEVHRLADTQT